MTTTRLKFLIKYSTLGKSCQVFLITVNVTYNVEDLKKKNKMFYGENI